ncbi:hypothetical protein NQ318_019329 [Aromia moschata]|uniref:Uncharacterized protein n=1 Tax=Aromia moschata TaxID=1265417 RepID=A0AAV8YCT4_9CUCU|nr:hypothetical protein NQ318_019329 [Aromia moschata]
MNSVDFLLTNKDITYEIRTEIKRLGRPIPDLIISKTDVGKSRNYSRDFNSSVYDRFKRLCGCPKRNKLFCFICLLIGGNRSAWTQEGLLKRVRQLLDKVPNVDTLIAGTRKCSKKSPRRLLEFHSKSSGISKPPQPILAR